MDPKREVLATAGSAQELLERQQQKAEELKLLAPQQDQRNDWGPIFANEDYDLRISKRAGMEQYDLLLMHKLKVGGGLLRWRQRT